MIENIGLNSAEFLNLGENIRVSLTSNFNAQDAFEHTLEDVALDNTIKTEQNQEEKPSAGYNLGAPAGFFLDTSLLSEEDKKDINCCSY